MLIHFHAHTHKHTHMQINTQTHTQVLGMLLRSKSHLINSNILHLTYTLVGTVDSEQESACIPNLIAFQDLLAGKSKGQGPKFKRQQWCLYFY